MFRFYSQHVHKSINFVHVAYNMKCDATVDIVLCYIYLADDKEHCYNK